MTVALSLSKRQEEENATDDEGANETGLEQGRVPGQGPGTDR
jgi:hypothetical protein